jgi:hypothetical protein
MEQHDQQTVDRARQLNELALSAGRSWQSPQTGYIHYCYQQQDEDLHHTIPLYDNALFALTLMSSRIAENIAEGKQILEGILNFHVHTGIAAGNFPVYMHEYPTCSNRLHAIDMIVPLYWIYRKFHHVIGSDMRSKLEGSLIAAAGYIRRQENVPYQLAMKGAVAVAAVGQMLGDSHLREGGQHWQQQIAASVDPRCWLSPSALSELLIAQQLQGCKMADADQHSFSDHLTACWHSAAAAYCGPGWCEWQDHCEPQVTLYDYFMGYLTGKYPYRVFRDHPVQLEAILVQPTDEWLTAIEYPLEAHGEVAGMAWQIRQTPLWAYSLIAKGVDFPAAQEKTFVPAKLLWGAPTRTHALVCQGGNVTKSAFTAREDGFDLYFTLESPPSTENREKSREISFYVDLDDALKLSVNGAAATTFRLDDQLRLEDGELAIDIAFTLESGQGNFFGHLMRGNRPSQLATKGKERFSAYDWQLFLRSTERSVPCVVKAAVTIAKREV